MPSVAARVDGAAASAARALLGDARRTRLGYVSADFGEHTMMMTNLLSVFGLHDAARFEVFCYALSGSDGSTYRERVEADCEHFAEIASRTSASDAAARIAL